MSHQTTRLGAALLLCIVGTQSVCAADVVAVAAAESFRGPLTALAARFQAGGADRPALTFAASATLAKQVEAGQAEIVICAQSWGDYLDQHGLLVPGSRRNLLGDHLLLIAAAGASAVIDLQQGAPLAALLRGKPLALADPDKTQTGRYAQIALQKLALWDDVAANLKRAENVRGALASVVQGEAALGIVYQTDLQGHPDVHVVGQFPDDSHPPIIYTFALTRSAKPQARAFLAEIEGTYAISLYRAAGFVPLAN
jgi:molybdate transport system substrate-binding protein